MDSYYLKWSNYYYKEHTEHLVIVVDVNVADETITVIDSIDKSEPLILKFEEVKRGCAFVLELIPPTKPITINQQSLEKAILDGSYEVIDKNRFEEMEAFAQSFLEMFSPDVEFRDKHNPTLMATEKMVDELRKNIRGINLFVLWMQWRDDTTGCQRFKATIECYKQIMSKWNLFINILYKKSMTHWEDTFYKKAYNNIMEITKLERMAYQSFQNCLESSCEQNETKPDKKEKMIRAEWEKTKDIKQENKQLQNIQTDSRKINSRQRVSTYRSYDLKPFMNNKGFLDDMQKNVANLTGVGEYFVWDVTPPKEYTHNKISFKIDFQQELDNVVCSGQKLYIQQHIQGIAIICCAEWGTTQEQVEFTKADGTKIYFPLQVKDISEYKDENACMYGTTYNQKDEIIQRRAAVFIEQITFPKENIQEIVLPKAENVHVLAMTLLY